jgi:hypothetical protein
MDAETIAALERAAERVEKEATAAKSSWLYKAGQPLAQDNGQSVCWKGRFDALQADAALIRALIERERNGGEVAQIARRKQRAAEVIRDLQEFLAMPEDLQLMAIYELGPEMRERLRQAIAAGAHKPQIITGQSMQVYATWDDAPPTAEGE